MPCLAQATTQHFQTKTIHLRELMGASSLLDQMAGGHRLRPYDKQGL